MTGYVQTVNSTGDGIKLVVHISDKANPEVAGWINGRRVKPTVRDGAVTLTVPARDAKNFRWKVEELQVEGQVVTVRR